VVGALVVDGMVAGGAVRGGLLVAGGIGAVSVVVGTGTVVAGGSGSGASLKITPGLTTVVAGAGGDVVPGLEETGGEALPDTAATVVVVVVAVVVVEARGSWAAPEPAAARKSTDVEVGAKKLVTVSAGRGTVASPVVRAASFLVAARIRITAAAPTTPNKTMFFRDELLLAYHHERSRSCASGRPNAARFPMTSRKR
jgi:hypothetical protein